MTGKVKEIFEDQHGEAEWEFEGDYTDSQRADAKRDGVGARLDATVERLEQLVINHRKFFDAEQFNAF